MQRVVRFFSNAACLIFGAAGEVGVLALRGRTTGEFVSRG